MPPDSRTLRPTSRCLPRLTIPSPLPRSLPRLFPLYPLLPPQVGLTWITMSTPRTAMSTPRTAMSTPRTVTSTPPPPCSSSPFSCHLRFAVSTSGSAISTPKTAQDVFRFRQRPPYDDFLLIRSGSRFSYSSLLHWLAIVALRPLASTPLRFRRVVNPESSNLAGRQLSFSKFYRPRRGRPPSTK